MTGFGDARRQDGRRNVTVEARTVNNRFLKCSVRLPDAYAAFEAEVEKLVRAAISRGTVHVTIRVERASEPGRYRIDQDLLNAYIEQAQAASAMHGVPLTGLESLLTLPGVVTERSGADEEASGDWPVLESAV